MAFQFDLINTSVLIIFTLNLFLGIFIFVTKKENKINQSFFMFLIAAMFWGLSMFLYRGLESLDLSVLFSRILYVSAALIPFAFLFFIRVFPQEKYNLPRKYYFFLFVPFLLIILISIIPDKLIYGVTIPDQGEKIINFNILYHTAYALYIMSYFSISYVLLFIKYFKFKGIEKQQIAYVIFGTLISTIIGVVTNLIMPYLNHFSLNWMGQVGIIVMIFSISYSILKHRLFSMKIIATQFIVFILCISFFVRTLISSSKSDFIINIIFLITTIIMSALLLRSVMKEVRIREEKEKLVQDLAEANEKLKELDQLKSEFLSLATHQIRAPLTAIKGYSSMLLEEDFGVLPQKAKDSIETIMKSCQNLIDIVGDFLNISRIEQGRMVYEKSIFDIVELVKEVINELKPNIQNAGLSLELEIPNNFSVKVNADKSKIKQVIDDIIDNAIKYTVQGNINISIFKTIDKVKIAIKDSGTGIDPNEINKLFNKFSRTKDASKTNVTGTGLGLYIAKKMIEANNGDIKVSSDGVGKGTTFTIELLIYKI